MCTAITYQTKDFYFGRNLDLHYGYNETVTVTPRNYPFSLRNGQRLDSHYAMIGMATVADNYPLYYEGTNECGVSIAGLNFPDSAVYHHADPKKINIAPFELTPWLLSSCATATEAKQMLSGLNLWDEPFNETFPLTPLHWLIADKDAAITVESTKEGLQISDNPVGVLANSPPFPYHLLHLTDYMHISPSMPTNLFSKKLPLRPYSLGMGGMGLPGDLSSASRFVRAAFVRNNAVSSEDECSSVSQFFHMLDYVAQPRGIAEVSPGEFEYTRYSSCCNASKGIYYYTSYENRQITAVDMHRCDLDSSALILFPFQDQLNIHYM